MVFTWSHIFVQFVSKIFQQFVVKYILWFHSYSLLGYVGVAAGILGLGLGKVELGIRLVCV